MLFMGKRYYTNRDALKEHYGRVYQLPSQLQLAGNSVSLWLIDYYGRDLTATPIFDEKSLPVVSTYLFSMAMLKKGFATLFVRRSRPEIIVASGDCYLGLLAWAIARLLRARFIFDIYDRYDEFPGYRRLPGFDPLVFLRQRADACFFASEIVPVQLGGRKDTDIIVPNGIDTDFFKPLDKVLCRRQMGLENEDILIGYFGSMEPDRGVDDLLQAVELLVNSGLSVRLLLAGTVADPGNFKLPYVLYLGNVAYASMPELLGCCDVLTLPYRRSAFMDAGASNKIAEYIAAGRPIAATHTPNLLANFQVGDKFSKYLAEPANPQSLAAAIRRALNSPLELSLPAEMTWPEISRLTLAKLTKLLAARAVH